MMLGLSYSRRPDATTADIAEVKIKYIDNRVELWAILQVLTQVTMQLIHNTVVWMDQS
jgi:putative aminopeptidase FrvX